MPSNCATNARLLCWGQANEEGSASTSAGTASSGVWVLDKEIKPTGHCVSYTTGDSISGPWYSLAKDSLHSYDVQVTALEHPSVSVTIMGFVCPGELDLNGTYGQDVHQVCIANC